MTPDFLAGLLIGSFAIYACWLLSLRPSEQTARRATAHAENTWEWKREEQVDRICICRLNVTVAGVRQAVDCPEHGMQAFVRREEHPIPRTPSATRWCSWTRRSAMTPDSWHAHAAATLAREQRDFEKPYVARYIGPVPEYDHPYEFYLGSIERRCITCGELGHVQRWYSI